MLRHFVFLAAPLLLAALPATGQIWDGGGGDDFLATAKNWNTNAVPANNGTAVLQFPGGTRPFRGPAASVSTGASRPGTLTSRPSTFL